MFNIIPKELNLNGKSCEFLDEYFKFVNEHRKRIGNEYGSQFEDSRDINQEDRTNCINIKPSKLAVQQKLKNPDLTEPESTFDAKSLYPADMLDETSVNPKIETGFASKVHINILYAEDLNFQKFNQDGKESAILKAKYLYPSNLIFQTQRSKKKLETSRLTG